MMLEYIYIYDFIVKRNHFWYKMPLYLIAQNEFDFDQRVYRLNGVVYNKHTPEFEEELAIYKTWLAISNPEPTALDVMYNYSQGEEDGNSI